MAKSKRTPSQRAQQIIGTSESDHLEALEAWSKCIREAMIEIEKKFAEDEWKLLGTVYTSSNAPLFHPSVPLAVILEHTIADFMLTPSTVDPEVAAKVIGKIKKLTNLESYALGYVLKDFAKSHAALENTAWWTLEQRIACSQ